ncbi:MAG: alkaline phosphatase [Actinomycetota bacterium]|nr:alkaline phosphatase [Actinomycetota bacterium]
MLDNDRDGFILMVEGGAVDWASHHNQSGRMIEEETEFNDAVDAVIEWVHHNGNWAETLPVVTGDHECGYLCGPGSAAAGRMQPIVNNGRGNLPGMERNSDEHTNALIPLYAKGFASIRFFPYADGFGRVRGLFMDNTGQGKAIMEILR